MRNSRDYHGNWWWKRSPLVIYHSYWKWPCTSLIYLSKTGIFHSNVNVYQSWTSRIAFWNDAEKRHKCLRLVKSPWVRSDHWDDGDIPWQDMTLDDVVNRIRKTLRFVSLWVVETCRNRLQMPAVYGSQRFPHQPTQYRRWSKRWRVCHIPQTFGWILDWM